MKIPIPPLQTSEGSDQLSVISDQLSVVSDQLSVVSDQITPHAADQRLITDHCSLITVTLSPTTGQKQPMAASNVAKPAFLNDLAKTVLTESGRPNGGHGCPNAGRGCPDGDGGRSNASGGCPDGDGGRSNAGGGRLNVGRGRPDGGHGCPDAGRGRSNVGHGRPDAVGGRPNVLHGWLFAGENEFTPALTMNRVASASRRRVGRASRPAIELAARRRRHSPPGTAALHGGRFMVRLPISLSFVPLIIGQPLPPRARIRSEPKLPETRRTPDE